MLTRCLDAILNQIAKIDNFIIVDNNSTDSTFEFLKEKEYLKNKIISYHELLENTGGAGGFYEGIKIAWDLSADWVWIMDDDVISENDCLNELI